MRRQKWCGSSVFIPMDKYPFWEAPSMSWRLTAPQSRTMRKKHMQTARCPFSPLWQNAWVKKHWEHGWTGHWQMGSMHFSLCCLDCWTMSVLTPWRRRLTASSTRRGGRNIWNTAFMAREKTITMSPSLPIFFSISERKAHFIIWRSIRRALSISKSAAMKTAASKASAIWPKPRWKSFLAIWRRQMKNILTRNVWMKNMLTR